MKRKFLSLLLTLCMVLSFMPATVFATGATSYEVWVGGTQVTSENADDVLGDGTVRYNPTTSTMTLNGANITGAEPSSNVGIYGSRGILAKNNLTIQLLGDNSVTAGEASYGSTGISVYGGKLTICGSGTLTAKGGTTSSVGSDSCGISASEIVISSGHITAVGGAGRNCSFGMYAWTNGITIKGGAVTATGGTCDSSNYNSYGIFLNGTQKIDITGGSGTASSLNRAMSVSPTLGGNVKIAEGSYNGSSFKWTHVNAMEVDLDGDGNDAPISYESFVDGWNAAINSNTANTTVKLLADWTADENGYFSSISSDGFLNGAGTADGYTGSIRIPSKKTIALDLNGHSIDRNLKSEVANGYAIVVNGTLTLQDSVGTGIITGGYDQEVGGVSVYGGTFTMEGGSVSGNHGAGVYILRNGKFTMKGGKIQNNDKYGVYFSNGTVTLSGAPVITGNTASGSDTGNFYLSSWKSVTIGSEGLSAGADIGISFATWPAENSSKTIATGSSGTDAGYFHSDKTGYETYHDGNTVKLRKASEEQKYTVTYNANDATSGSVPTDSTAYASGASVTVLANSGNLQKTCGTFAGWNTKADGGGDSYAAGGAFSISADTVLYAQWTEAHTFDSDGFCKATEGETHFQPAVLNDGVYEISNAGQLYWFAETVNGGEKASNGKLMNDIDLSVSQTIPWVPIGQNAIYYSGSFNGGGHTVSNLYINNTADYQGFFGKFDGTLTSLTITGEIHSGHYAGGICGNMGTQGRISNCTNAADILCTGNCVGGIVGYNYGEISNCRNLADIQGAGKVGGICGFNNEAKDWNTNPPVVTSWGTIKNCYNTGAVTSTTGSEAGGICGASIPVKGTALFNNYCIDSVTYGCFWSTDHVEGFLEGAVESKTAEQFASGEVAYLLNSGKTDGTQVWLQTIGTDSLPRFTGSTVYQVKQYDCPADTTAAITYSNTDSEIRGTAHSFTHYTSNDDSTCTADGTKTATCDYCDETDIITDTGSMKAHDFDHHEAKAPTCTEIGWEAYDTCKNCNQLFDKNKNEVTAANLVIAKLDHSFSDEWKSDGINHWKECACGDKTDIAAHDFKWVVDKEATAAAAGSKHEECKICGYQKATVEIPATGTSVSQTGDNSNIVLWLMLMLAAGAAFVTTTAFKRKENVR